MAEWIDTLAGQAFDGDEDAWRRLFHALTPRLWGLFHRLGSSPEEAEDRIQEAWTRILTSHEQFDRTRPFEPWVFTIATRIWIDWYRCHKRIPHSHRLPEDEPGDACLPMDLLFAAENTELIHHCLETLTDEEKVIIVLRFWQDLTNAKVADRLASTESSIRGKGYRAIRKLADCMQL